MSSLRFSLVQQAFEILSGENQRKIVNHSLPSSVRWKSGATAGKVNSYWSDFGRTLVATSENLDLNALLDADGATISWDLIKLVLIRNRNLVAGEDLTWGPATVEGWGVGAIVKDGSDRRIVPAGRTPKDRGIDFWVDPIGHAVVNNASDKIFLDAGSNTVVFDILVIGTD